MLAKFRAASKCLSSTSRDAPAALARFYSGSETLEVEVLPFETHKCDPPSTTVTTTKDELLGWFESMFKIRRMEIASDKLYKDKLIRGFCHLYDGQEAVITGLHAGCTMEDSIITSYRDHALHLCRGGTVKEVIGELLGRSVGASLGLGGSMHFYSKENNFYGGCGIVGAQVPLGAGLALAHKMQGNQNVGFALYGDGAANQGQIAEAMNISALWQVPVIFLCENNHYGMGTSEWRGSASPTFYKRGDYIPGIRVDGMDVLAMKQATVWAKEFALKNGPLCFEADTYRYHGHSMSDPGSTYRTRDEVTTMRQARDPVERVRKLLLDSGFADAKQLKAIEKKVKDEIETVIKECTQAPQPELNMLQSNLYMEPNGIKMRGARSDQWIAATVKPYVKPGN